MELPTLRPSVTTGTTTFLSSTEDLPGVRLRAAKVTLFGVYQDWVHKNPSINQDGWINEDDKWQTRQKNFPISKPTLQRTIWTIQVKVCLNLCSGAQWHTRSTWFYSSCQVSSKWFHVNTLLLMAEICFSVQRQPYGFFELLGACNIL